MADNKNQKKVQRAVYKQVIEHTNKVIKEKPVIEVKGRVTAQILNIREKPDINSKVIAQLTNGQIVDIFNELDDWYQIVQNGVHKGFVVKKYISIVRFEKNGVVTANTLNVRQSPNTESAILGKLGKNDVVNILKEYDEWLKITYKGSEAFVSKQFVRYNNVPLENNPIVGDESTYFYQREDLAEFPMAAKKQIEIPKDYNGAIAAKLWNNYGGLVGKISDELDIDVATALSVLCVESHGKGFENNKMLIRFENHVFDMFWGKNNVDEFDKYFKYDKASRRNGHYYRKSEKDEWIVCHTSQETEWDIFNFAKTIDETAAHKSISMGAPQVMGFNHKFIGYASPQEMFAKFESDIRYHFLALFDFCKYKPERIRYLQRRDFYQFAYEYNGPADPKAYEERLKKYYEILLKILPK